MGKTTIEWCDFSINPLRARDRNAVANVGHHCEKISPGCQNCYASRLQSRFNLTEFAGPSRREHVHLWLDEDKLGEVLRRNKPTRYFWCDMTDLFGEWVLDEWIDQCFATMALTPQHTHQVLTKRPWNMLRYLRLDKKGRRRIWLAARELTSGEQVPVGSCFRPDPKRLTRPAWLYDATDVSMPWPLPNVWLGVSVEDQQRADERIPLLLQTPAAVRFLSVEPLLESIDLAKHLRCPTCGGEGERVPAPGDKGFVCEDCGRTGGSWIHWAILGGESGPGARPLHLSWWRSLVRQCAAAAVPCFSKQAGAHLLDDTGADQWPQGVRLHVGASMDAPRRVQFRDPKGGDPAEWVEDLRVRQFP